MFDALRYIKSLEEVGFRRDQAEAQVQLVMDCFKDNIATKTDLEELKAATKADFAGFRSEIKVDIENFKSGIKMDFADFRSDLVFKLGGLMIACTGILGLLIKF